MAIPTPFKPFHRRVSDMLGARLNLTDPAETEPASEVDESWKPGDEILVKFLNGTEELHERVKRVAQEWAQCAGIYFDFVKGLRARSVEAVVRVEFTDESLRKVSSDTSRKNGALPNAAKPTLHLAVSMGTEEGAFRRAVLQEFGREMIRNARNRLGVGSAPEDLVVETNTLTIQQKAGMAELYPLQFTEFALTTWAERIDITPGIRHPAGSRPTQDGPLQQHLFSLSMGGRLYHRVKRDLNLPWRDWEPGFFQFPRLVKLFAFCSRELREQFRGTSIPHNGLSVLGLREDDKLHYAYWDGGNWSECNFLTMKNAPDVIHAAMGQSATVGHNRLLQIFAVSSGHEIYHTWRNEGGIDGLDNGWNGWTRQFGGANLPPVSSVTTMPGESRLDVFALGLNGLVYQMHFSERRWSSWEKMDWAGSRANLPGEESPAIVSIVAGATGGEVPARNLYLIGEDGAVYWTTCDRVTGQWGTLGKLVLPDGAKAKSAQVVCRDGASLEVLVVGDNGVLYTGVQSRTGAMKEWLTAPALAGGFGVCQLRAFAYEEKVYVYAMVSHPDGGTFDHTLVSSVWDGEVWQAWKSLEGNDFLQPCKGLPDSRSRFQG